MEDITKLSRSQLDAELELYRANPTEGIEVAAPETLPNRDAAIAEIERLREVAGYPHFVTEDDLNGVLKDEAVEVGEMVFITKEEMDQIQADADQKGERGALIEQLSGLVEEGPTKADFLASLESRTNEALSELFAQMKASLESAPDAQKPVAPSTAPNGPGTNVSPSGAADEDLVYKGKTVIRHGNKLIHGKLYIEVDVSTEVYTLTPEEFEAEVLPRDRA